MIGGGNSAAVEASLLAETCSKVTVVQNLPSLTCDAASAEALLAHPNVELICGTIVEEYLSEGGSLTGLKLKNTETGEGSVLYVDGCFIAIGLKPENSPFAGVASLDRAGYIPAGEDTVPDGAPAGIYVAGDCRAKRIRQISTAAADGAVAALAACAYIDGLK